MAMLLFFIAFLTVSGSFEVRFAVAIGLLAIGDFAKKMVFLVPGQAPWSQYLIFVLPYIYFAVALLMPWVMNLRLKRLNTIQRLIALLMGIMLINTWLAQDANLISKAAATLLLILPWGMVAIAADYPDAMNLVSKIVITVGFFSVFYAIWQFVFGPTVIELKWSQAVGGISIGADHINAFLTNRYSGANIFRPIGFQADAFTFGLYSLNAFVFAWMSMQNKTGRKVFLLIAFVLFSGILVSVVRTVWMGAIFMLIYAFLARRFLVLLKPGVVLMSMIGLYFATNLASNLLYSLNWISALFNNQVIARALTFGTLADRIQSLDNFWQLLSQNWLMGLGYAASPWISRKFGGFDTLVSELGQHNVVNQLLLYVGLPGLLLFFAIVLHALRSAWKRYHAGLLKKSALIKFVAYILGIYLIGLGNGDASLNIYFFLLLGCFVADHNPSTIGSRDVHGEETHSD